MTVLRTELKRSAAPWAGALVLTTSLAFLHLVDGEWWRGTTAWTAQWTPLALWTRSLLYYLWPMAVGIGALQGLRDHRSTMSELLTSTPRPAWHRAALQAGTTAATLAVGFTLLVLTGGVQVLAHAPYQHLGWLPVSLVAVLALAAGAVLGMGIGRALPFPLTPPALAVGAFAFTTLLHMSLGRTRTTTPDGFPVSRPNRLSLLSPTTEDIRSAFATLSGAVDLGQTLWFLGLAATGFALLVAATPRTRLLALIPALACTALALPLLPTDPGRMYVVDRAAAAPVCDGPVCVTRTHRDRLTDLAGPGKEALRRLHTALGDSAPAAVRENTALLPEGSPPRWSRDTVLIDFDTLPAGKGQALTRALIGLGMVPGCTPVGWQGIGPEDTARTVAVAWVLGALEPTADPEARTAWRDLTSRPHPEQLARIDAMRTAAYTCRGEPFEALKGASR
ncbi:hypothetical protein [Streptomyces sp. ST1015]|uniref:hypothetical protein n=1 Tax=unclassified Streptomyces TaxID=2593676 RepID=UPI001CA6529B|nr:hypothetical protein [Streptomyces sp. ST1015]QZZ24937.1 hypothetical protein A7X85_00180 [Streptomyces sp. ST1015]